MTPTTYWDEALSFLDGMSFVAKQVINSTAQGGTSGGTGTGTTTAKVRHSLKASPPETYAQRYVDGESILQGDAMIILPAENLAFTPKPGIRVELLGQDWSIIAANPIMTGEQVGAYQIQIRR